VCLLLYCLIFNFKSFLLKNNINEIKIGSIVAVNYYNRNNWYRAEIIGFENINGVKKVIIFT
jgi:hypothetical protein